MAAELPRPGVEVIQEFQSTAPTVLRPTLVPFVCGAAKEIVEVTTPDGLLNAAAKQGTYTQLPRVISQTAFPSPRNNIAEVDVDEASIKVFFQFGGNLKELERNPGESFLVGYNYSSQPAIRTKFFAQSGGLNLNGLTLVLALDVTSRLNTTKDVTVTFTGTNPIGGQDIVDQINAAVGDTVASLISFSTNYRVQIKSNKWGTAASVTVRPGGSANTVLGFASGSVEYRVEGSGFYAQDQNNGTTLSSWIAWSKGAYQTDGTTQGSLPSYSDGGSPTATAGFGFIDSTGTFNTSYIKSSTAFTGGSSLDLKVGDQFWADGTLPNGGAVIMKVEASRFKLGLLNSKLSTFDDNGKVTNAVYDESKVNTLLAGVPFAPRYSWFEAENLVANPAATAATLTGSNTGSAATAAIITAPSAPSGVAPYALAGLTLLFDVTIDGVLQPTQTFTFTGGPFADLAAIEAAVNGAGLTGITAIDDGTHIKFETTRTGQNQSLVLESGSTALSALGFVASTAYTATGTDVSFSGLSGEMLKFKLNGGAQIFQTTFASNSLLDAVTAINEVVGFTVASVGGGGSNELKLTSTLKGYASSITVIDDSQTSAANTNLGFGGGNRTASGTGRPNPDFSVDISGSVVLGAEILRSALTGEPFSPGSADIYVQYKGLRKDVSPLAAHPALLRLSNATDLSTVLSPINADNPLALGLFFTIINAPGIECTGMGVDEMTASAPFGTLAAFTRVANFIESEEVYAIAPLTHDDTVHQMFQAHVDAMSGPEQKGERIVFINPSAPLRAVDEVVASGLLGASTSTANQLLTETSVAPGLVSLGLNPLELTYSDQVYMEITVDGEVRRYLMSLANGALNQFTVTFSAGQNADSFFSVTPLTETVIDTTWSVKQRGALLLIPGSTLPDKDKIAETVAAQSSAYKDRRVYKVFPDLVTATIDGTDELIDGFYACAAIAGMVARFPPQQGFTNMTMTGFTGVKGSNDTYSVKQLNVMAGGGTYVLVQDAVGAPIVSRHQLSTNLTSIEARELSITKVVDYVAKFLRTGLRNFIGTFNITQPFLDTLSTIIQGMLGFLVENGIILGGDLNNLIQAKDAPDTVLVDVTLDVPFPCNYIRLTLVI
jgi:hypothetical protein